jgi:hypothetical protein
MNRTELANKFVEKFAKEEGIPVEDVNGAHCYASSSLGVALEYLGKLNDIPEAKEYMSHRDGINGIGTFELLDEETKQQVLEEEGLELDDVGVLTTRQIFEALEVIEVGV